MCSSDLANINLGDETVIAEATVQATGEELTATVNTFAVVAGGSIVINTPTLEANVSLNNDGIVVGTANFIQITGEEITTFLGNVSTTSENFIPITGSQVAATANSIAIRADQILTITGNGITTSLGNVTLNTNNFISVEGLNINANVTSLKFWDPITGNIVETWVNIH